MHAACFELDDRARGVRGLHDLKLAANDRGSGGLTSIRPFLSATSFHCFQQCVSRECASPSVHRCALSVFSLFSSNANSPSSGKSKQVSASPSVFTNTNRPAEPPSFCRTSMLEQEREREKRSSRMDEGAFFGFHPLERRFLACVYRS